MKCSLIFIFLKRRGSSMNPVPQSSMKGIRQRPEHSTDLPHDRSNHPSEKGESTRFPGGNMVLLFLWSPRVYTRRFRRDEFR